MTRNRQDVFNDLLVLRCQGGDTAALETLARAWHPSMLRHAFRLTGERDAAAEIAQDAWLAIVRGLGRLNDPAVFRGWAYRIVANKSRDWIRRRQARRRLTDRVEREPRPAAADDTDDREAAIRRLRAALETLPDDRRALLSMHYLEGMGVREIALALSIPPGTVKSRLFHARRQLKALTR
ncbi:MAG: RNA polymerase sigma factor [bacterium]|nr:RNA polymerase sigma factor [bacterium]